MRLWQSPQTSEAVLPEAWQVSQLPAPWMSEMSVPAPSTEWQEPVEQVLVTVWLAVTLG